MQKNPGNREKRQSRDDKLEHKRARKAVAGEEGGGGGWRKEGGGIGSVVIVTSKTTTRGAKRVFEKAWGGESDDTASSRWSWEDRPLRQCGVHTAIRMAPFNMAGIAGLLATCAAVAASAAHLLPLLLLLICPRGTQADQGKRSSVRFPYLLLPYLLLSTYLRRANQAEMIVRRHPGLRYIAPIATLGCILSQMYQGRVEMLPATWSTNLLSRKNGVFR